MLTTPLLIRPSAAAATYLLLRNNIRPYLLSRSPLLARRITSSSTPPPPPPPPPPPKMPKYYNRELIPLDTLINDPSTLTKPIIKKAKIISLSDVNDDANKALHHALLPESATLLAIGSTFDDFDIEKLKQEEPNVIFVSHPLARKPLVELIETFPTIEWIHARSAGIDFITSEGLAAKSSSNVLLTNAKGQFSSTLAEYTMMACAYFAKDLPRLLSQKKSKNWCKYPILEIRNSTLGIIGYGDIGRACAKMAKLAYGMRVMALRRNHSLEDEYCDVMLGSEEEGSLKRIMKECDYILISAPLTEGTRGLISREVLEFVKPEAVIINVGRGPIIDEEALIDALKNNKLKGAALDVFSTEPLPTNSELWELDNVLISPHNMDQTKTFMHEATEFFVRVQLPLFMRGMELFNPVDKVAGY